MTAARDLALTGAQEGIWFAHHLDPIHTTGERIDITGPLAGRRARRRDPRRGRGDRGAARALRRARRGAPPGAAAAVGAPGVDGGAGRPARRGRSGGRGGGVDGARPGRARRPGRRPALRAGRPAPGRGPPRVVPPLPPGGDGRVRLLPHRPPRRDALHGAPGGRRRAAVPGRHAGRARDRRRRGAPEHRGRGPGVLGRALPRRRATATLAGRTRRVSGTFLRRSSTLPARVVADMEIAARAGSGHWPELVLAAVGAVPATGAPTRPTSSSGSR